MMTNAITTTNTVIANIGISFNTTTCLEEVVRGRIDIRPRTTGIDVVIYNVDDKGEYENLHGRYVYRIEDGSVTVFNEQWDEQTVANWTPFGLHLTTPWGWSDEQKSVFLALLKNFGVSI